MRAERGAAHPLRGWKGLRGAVGGMRAVGALLATALLAAGCAPHPLAAFGFTGDSPPGGVRVVGSGTLVTRELDLRGFTEVEVGSAFQVDVVHSDSPSAAVTADDNVIDLVEATLQGRTLKLGLRSGSYQNATLRARIALPDLQELRLSEAASGTVSGFKELESVSLRLSGASKLVGRLDASDVRLVASEASKVTLGGQAGALLLESSGASDANLGDLVLKDAKASLGEASKATLNVKGRLDAQMSGASTLLYLGNPTLGSVESTGGSTLKRR